MGAPLFEFVDVAVRGEGDQWRLHGATGVIPDHGITGLVGPSGSGKSTLLRCCNRLEVPDAGEVRFRGANVNTLDVLALRRRVSMVFQRPTPFPGTCRDNLRVAQPELGEEPAQQLLARVRLGAEFLDRNATQLSGGEAQRLCLARALAAEPEAVLMDEATSSLDPAGRFALEDLARGLASDDVPIVWVTHDLSQVRRLADTVLVVVHGHIADADEEHAFMQEAEHGE